MGTENPAADDETLYAWEIHRRTELEDMPIDPAPTDRAWMDQTNERYAYRCLPLVMANQAGWILRCPTRVTVRWNGGTRPQDLRLWYPRGKRDDRICSHFGDGVLTFTIPYLFRTPPDINLWVKGPSNSPKDGIQPLEGIVESDWSEFSFTMNWKFTRPDVSVRFEEGEPICMIVPIQRGLAESLQPIRKPLRRNRELKRRYERWRKSRQDFNEGLRNSDEEAVAQGWQRDYMLGRDGDGVNFESHQTRLSLREFRQE